MNAIESVCVLLRWTLLRRSAVNLQHLVPLQMSASSLPHRKMSANDPKGHLHGWEYLPCNELNIPLVAILVHIKIGSQVASYRFGNLLVCDHSVHLLWVEPVEWRSTLVKLFVQIVSSVQRHLPARLSTYFDPKPFGEMQHSPSQAKSKQNNWCTTTMGGDIMRVVLAAAVAFCLAFPLSEGAASSECTPGQAIYAQSTKV